MFVSKVSLFSLYPSCKSIVSIQGGYDGIWTEHGVGCLFVAHCHRKIGLMFSGFGGCLMLCFCLGMVFKIIGHKCIAVDHLLKVSM